MSKAAYTHIKCPYCGKQISTSGGGVNHYRKHVREGVLVERREFGYAVFERVKKEDSDVQAS